jgi:16S rRNA processing protein RimM
VATPEYAIVGRLRKAHGVRGEVVVEVITDTPDAIFAAGGRVFAGTADGAPTRDPIELHIQSARPFKGGLLIHFEEITDRDTADSWRERYLLVPVSEVAPQGLTLEVKRSNGSALIPYREGIVVNTDRDARQIVIDPPEGLLD